MPFLCLWYFCNTFSLPDFLPFSRLSSHFNRDPLKRTVTKPLAQTIEGSLLFVNVKERPGRHVRDGVSLGPFRRGKGRTGGR